LQPLVVVINWSMVNGTNQLNQHTKPVFDAQSSLNLDGNG